MAIELDFHDIFAIVHISNPDLFALAAWTAAIAGSALDGEPGPWPKRIRSRINAARRAAWINTRLTISALRSALRAGITREQARQKQA
jgi:hypothetical protein